MPASTDTNLPPIAACYFPAAPAALDHLLLAATANQDPQRLVEAFEADPGLLLHALCSLPRAGSDLTDWHKASDQTLLRALALARGLVSTDIHHGDTDYKPLRRALLAAALARHAAPSLVAESRLASLLGDAGLWLNPGVAIDVGQHAHRAAEFLEELGITARSCDAIRYQMEKPAALAGVDPLIRITAAARALLDDEDASRTCADLLSLDISVVQQALRTSAQQFNEQVDRINRNTDGARHTLAVDAVLADVIAGGEGDLDGPGLLAVLVRFLFGDATTFLFTLDEGELVCLANGARLATRAGNSRIAEAWRRNEILRASMPDLDLVLERQLVTRSNASNLLLVPLPGQAGVIAIATNQITDSLIRRDRHLLGGVAHAVARRIANDPIRPQSDTVISIDELERRTREITHEVNNPLAILQNYLKALSIKLGNDSFDTDIKAMTREVKRISKIVEKYREIGQPTQVRYSNVDLNNLVGEQLALIQASASHIQFAFDADPDIPVLELPGDLLKQITLNVLKNAVEALEGEATPTVTIRTDGAVNVAGHPFLELTIADNGPGMDQGQRLTVFEEGVSTKGAGRGMGLAIVRSMMTEIGGSVSCRANWPQGSIFALQIPVGRQNVTGDI